MRTIKFRQWVKHSKLMFFDIGMMKEGGWCGPPKLDFVDNPLMQYTGLKDKNGKEVFENDLVSCVATDADGYDHGICGVVEWDNDDAAFIIVQELKSKWPVVAMRFARNLVVMGNIYEKKGDI